MNFDVVICVGVKDVFIVKKTIKYVLLHIHPRKIFLITNPRFFNFFKSIQKKYVEVTLINESQLIDGVDITVTRRLVNAHFINGMRAGWYFQQFLKMGFALSQYAKDYYLVWDADTIPTSDLNFFSESGSVLMAQKEEYHTPYFETMSRLIGLGKSVDFSFIAEHMMFNVTYMQELIEKISSSSISGSNWCEKIINATNPNTGLAFSEFETYGTFIHTYHPQSVEYRHLHTMRHAGRLFGRLIKDYEIKEFEGVTHTISLEAGDFPHGIRKWGALLQLVFLRIFRP